MITSRLLRTVQYVIVSFVSLLLPLTGSLAHAETINIIPPKFELYGNPGDILNEKLRIRNEGTEATSYTTDVQDFTASGEEGGVNFVEDPNAPTTAFSLANWVNASPKNFTIPGGQEQTINVDIRIPKGAEPGSHFASIQVQQKADIQPGGTGAAVQSKLNSLILLRVSGNLTEKLSLDSFRADDNYYQKGPVDLSLRTKNEGNVHIAPTGTIVITDTFNRKVAEVPLKQANVLPGSFRTIKTSWDPHSSIGRFTATLVATYGQSKEPITSTATFYIIPLPIILILVGILVILFLTITQRKGLRKFLHHLTAD
jgi:hypothetical protein